MSKRSKGPESKPGASFGNPSLRDALSKLKADDRARAEAEEKAAAAARDRARAEAKQQKRSQVGARPTTAEPARPPAQSRTISSPARPSTQRRDVSAGPDDDLLFRIAMEDVVPLSGKSATKTVTPGAPLPPPTVVSDEAEALAQLAELVATGEGLDLSDTDEYMEGLSQGVDRSLLEALRRGDFSVQGHVDLHGLGVEAARDELERFLFDSRRKGARCVVVVHGRGLHSKDREPVLKERVGVWLSRGKLSRIVLAFATARPVDGGAGALYVLLRR